MSTITPIAGGDSISSSRSVINTNFSNLNTDKEETTNKKITMTGNTTSNVFFLSAKAIYDWAVGAFAPALGTDDNYVTDAQLVVIVNTSGTNTGDQDLSGLQTTLVSGTNIKTINGTTILGSGDLEITAGSGGYSANVFLTTLTSAVVPAYKQTSYTPEVAETLVSGTANNNTVLIQSYVFDLPLGVTSIDAGTWEFHPTYYVNSATGDTRMIFDVYSRTTGGTETLLFTRTSDEINNTTRDTFTIQSTQSAFSVNATDYLVIKISVSTTSTSNKTLTYVVGDGEATHFITPLVLRHNQLRARDAADSHPASAITNTPAGNIIATTVQDAINELDTEKATPANITDKPEVFSLAIGDETTAITTGTSKLTFRMPYAFTITAVRASLTTTSTSGIPTFDINEGGVSILSTKLTIDANELTSTTASTPVVISDTALADDAEITIDIDVAGTGAKGPKIYIIGHQ